MRKSLIVSWILAGITVVLFPLALWRVNEGKNRITVTEEVLWGNPAEAEGVTLELPSHWGGQLLWNTRYTIGSSEGARSEFAFSSAATGWGLPETETEAGIHFTLSAGFEVVYGDGAGSIVFDFDQTSYAPMVSRAAERTKPGEERTERMRIGDYIPYCPLTFQIEGHSVSYQGDYEKKQEYLTEFFHISTEEDKAEITVEKDGQGNIVSVRGQAVPDGEGVIIANAAADGGEGIYFCYCLENAETGEIADRGEERGIFYFPYEETENGFWNMDLQQVRKICDFPGDMIPVQMRIDREKGNLYLIVRKKEDYSLLIYRRTEEALAFMQQIPVGRNCLLSENPESKGVPGGSLPYAFCSLSVEDGGLLMTWKDNRFSFVAEEEGQYRLWCDGVFPAYGAQNESDSRPFPREQVCVFQGDRLVLAAYEGWRSMNVLLAVYDRQAQVYAGRYVHSGSGNEDVAYVVYEGTEPQGSRSGVSGRTRTRKTRNETVEPLRIEQTWVP